MNLSEIDPAKAWELVELVCVLSSGCTVATLLTRSRARNPALDWILRFLNAAAGNVLGNRNADTEPTRVGDRIARKLPTLIVLLAIPLVACESPPVLFNPTTCAVLVERLEEASQELAELADPADEERQELRRTIGELLAELATAGCQFVPVPTPPEEVPAELPAPVLL